LLSGSIILLTVLCECVTYPHTKRKTPSVFGNVLKKMTAPTRQEARQNCTILPFNKCYYVVKLRKR